MALDTAHKRSSAVGWGLPWRPLPPPDGSMAANDRLHAAYAYSGVAAALPGTDRAAREFLAAASHRARALAGAGSRRRELTAASHDAQGLWASFDG